MTDLPAALFGNPVWHALHGPHRHLAIDRGLAARYPADVSPFAALAEPSVEAFEALRDLLAPRDPVWIIDRPPSGQRAVALEGSLEGLQRVLPRTVSLPEPGGAGTPGAVAAGAPTTRAGSIDSREPPPVGAADAIEPLGARAASEMVALTDAAFPGFFRPGTYRMGAYFGIRRAGALAAMAGERLVLEGYPEMSGICTHPDHRGRGLARRLIVHLAQEHRRRGVDSWLHVGSANAAAAALYRALGFATVRTIVLHRVVRTED